MSIRLPPSEDFSNNIDDDSVTESSESSEDDNDQNWDDWASDSLAKAPCKSLFDDEILPTVNDALNHDKNVHNYDLNTVCRKLALDFHGRIRLINWIRKIKPTPTEALALTGKEVWFTSDEYLLPSVEDDPLLQVQPDDWSDSEDEDGGNVDPARRILTLERKLAQVQQDFSDYRHLVSQNLDIKSIIESAPEPESSSAPAARDDDTHYFDSYAENEIHAIMIQDQVRTSTYAHFILTHPILFRDAVVLDVGCGTGILSLFAARSGAKRVIAVDASAIAERAERIVKENGFEDVITVIRGKVEDITLPDDIQQVDIIVSEWMGYALLYESMLDSVLHARDRFLRPGGVMAPSQCKMQLGLCDASEVYNYRIGFWGDVYGFDLSTMAEGLYDEAVIDVVGPETMLSAPYTVKDIIISDITPRQLDFSSSFMLVSTSGRRSKVNAFVLYFDTFFNPSGLPISPSAQVKYVRQGEPVLAETWPVGGKPPNQRRRSSGVDKEAVTSFSTGPQSMPTHWKQTLFLLREPISVVDGSIVQGTFYCRKSPDNSRELDVEIHYSVKQDPDSPAGDTVVQIYKVR